MKPSSDRTVLAGIGAGIGTGTGSTSDNTKLRFKTAKMELEHALNAHYFYFVINDDLDKTVDLVDHIAHSTDRADKYRDPAAEEVAKHLLEEITRHI